jgi:hypothetical protein
MPNIMEIIDRTPVHLMFLGLVGVICLFIAVSFIKDIFAWLFWHVFIYFVPFLLWYYHPYLKTWYAWLFVTAVETSKRLVAQAQQMAEENKDSV